MTIDALLKKWLGKAGGAERANYQMFLGDFCRALGLPGPEPAGAGVLGDYQYEGPVKAAVLLGKGTGRIDLYKRDSFILEAKQSQLKPGEQLPLDVPAAAPVALHDLLGNVVGHAPAAPRYDRLMADARIQAERYALALPADHGAPPFLIVADIGRSFELYFDWAGNGRGYSFFPDQQSFRFPLERFAEAEVRELFAAIWTDPGSVDPRLKAVAVTRAIAVELAKVATDLEQSQKKGDPDPAALALGIESTSLFLMRMLFCMFAEDVELLEKGSFQRFLEVASKSRPQYWTTGLRTLWQTMNDDGPDRYWPLGDALVRYFNGNLFADTRIYEVSPGSKTRLYHASKMDWRAVEPAIFGTLLEQVLTPAERAKLGAHYTPRAYVERLVEATIMDVLRPEWEAAQAAARALIDAGEAGATAAAARIAADFQAKLSDTIVLDPACGTGNFLYVAMEQLLRLEGEVVEFARTLGHALTPAVHPNQFKGLEKNPRAAVIAELVLWIGWLRHRLANTPDAIHDPVLPTLTNINFGTHGGYDAVLALTDTGEPDTANPRQPPWPEADFIIGNPPFIGAKHLREHLGGDYVEALWRANPHVPQSADLVMQWWDRAATILTCEHTRLRRFGLVTTNSITQTFSRRVIDQWLNGMRPLSIVMAVRDHPWTKATRDAAAVRIGMSVAESGTCTGRLLEVVREAGLDSDSPEIGVAVTVGTINSDLTIGTDATKAKPLRASEGLASPGVKLHGAGFIVTVREAAELGLNTRSGLGSHIRRYLNGRDLLQSSRDAMVIDLLGLPAAEIRTRFPEVWQHLYVTVKPERDANRRASYRDNWLIFGEPRRELRPALAGLNRYIVTPVTSKHRVFAFVDGDILPDDALIAIALSDAFSLGVLASSIHARWTFANCGLIGVASFQQGHRYLKSITFDPFPFPDPTPEQRAVIADLAEELDATRKAVQAEHADVTLTGLYNLVARLRSGVALTDAEARAATRARAHIVRDLHDRLDRAVADAYGWPADLGADEIVARLVALNAERAAEEAAGHVRWLRPDYQNPGG